MTAREWVRVASKAKKNTSGPARRTARVVHDQTAARGIFDIGSSSRQWHCPALYETDPTSFVFLADLTNAAKRNAKSRGDANRRLTGCQSQCDPGASAIERSQEGCKV